MSAYERYDEAAVAFEQVRAPLGAEILAGCLTAAPLPLGEVTLLDAGCGTGQYSAALVDLVGQITAIDLSEGMLAVARRKLAREERGGKIRFQQGSVDDLPFPASSFDAVMFNQVLHHLEGGADPEYGGHRRALGEAHRVLRPGGVLMVNACSHEQLKHGFWYYDLIPEALEAMLGRCVPRATLEAILASHGFTLSDRIVPLDGVMQGDTYFDPRGPRDPEWRRGDSIWALASTRELSRAEARIAELDSAGRLEAYLEECDATRRQYGQFTFYLARKP